MIKVKKWLRSYFRSGLDEQRYNDINSQITIIYFFSFVGMLVTGVLAVNALFNNNYLLALTLLVSHIVYFLCFYIYKVTKTIKLSLAIILYSNFILMSYLVYSGGVDNTGPLWIFILPSIALFINGLIRGIVVISAFIAFISLLMFYPNEALLATSYPLEFKLRLLYSFITVSALSAYYEYARESSYLHTLELSRKYELLSRLDPLTQLSNRRDATNTLEHEQLRLARNAETLAIIICDVDYFKKINDSFGHSAGDYVLVELAKLFKHCSRGQDTIARWGGEEFLFILPQTNLSHAQDFAAKLHLALEQQQMCYQEQLIEVTLSMGISELKPEQSIQEAISIADKYLYQAKQAGRNQTFPQISAVKYDATDKAVTG
ncbi:GGDEF domain-containing protein [Thalassomonas sp. RHCl1]|uniref:GGDEF domain-containing protein n=1 Tax=Thalassomonas sp. RHCl1 TaxID=2995320 RepID=UPI00248A9A2B|nr:GGDEF domain-containing protein [Thalassomonas sp. RHCl1]